MSLEKKEFSVHPGIIKTLILEQSGTPYKAILELIMNSADAGATEVYVEVDHQKFSVKDNGVGFKSKDQIIDFFGTFGTPHDHNDAQYGVFRMGRGQCFGLSRSTWRSGHFEMHVDLDGLKDKSENQICYELKEFDQYYDGCLIEGEFFTPLHKHGEFNFLNGQHFDTSLTETLDAFKKAINTPKLSSLLNKTPPKGFTHPLVIQFFKALCLFPIPVYFNGVQLSQVLPTHCTLTTDIANYYELQSVTTQPQAFIFNQGVFVCIAPFPVTILMDLKHKPDINIARNMINKSCLIYIQAQRELRAHVWQQVFKQEPYYDYFLPYLYAQISRHKRLNAPSLIQNNFMEDFTAEDFFCFLSVSYLNICQTQSKYTKISLLELIEKIKDKEVAHYHYISYFTVKNRIGLSNLKAFLKEEQERTQKEPEDIIVYGVCEQTLKQEITPDFFVNIFQKIAIMMQNFLVRFSCDEDTQEVLGAYTLVSEYFPQNYQKLNAIKFKHQQQTVIKDKNGFSFNGLPECKPKQYELHEGAIKVLERVVEQVRTATQKAYGISEHSSVIGLKNHPLVDRQPIKIKLLHSGAGHYHHIGGSCSSMIYLNHNNEHLLLVNINQLIRDTFKAWLLVLPESINSNFALDVYLTLTDAYFKHDVPLHALHELRVKHETAFCESDSVEATLFDELMHINEQVVEYVHTTYEKNRRKLSQAQLLKEQKYAENLLKFGEQYFEGFDQSVIAKFNEIIKVKN